MEQLGMEPVDVALAALGVVMYANRAGYLYFVVRPRAILFLAGIGAAMAWSYAHAETDEAFILNSFPRCKSSPVFSPYSAGAVGAIEAKQRADWYSKLKPIAGAPCVLPADNGVTFCDMHMCRNMMVR